VKKVLEIRNLVKEFPGVKALQGVDLDVRGAEVHCLLGANGAGKSTLIKCVSGALEPTSGEILFQGEPLPPGDPAGTLKRGIATIYQELDLVPDLSVAESVFLAHEPRRWPLLDLEKMYQESAALLARLGHNRSPCVRRWASCGRQPSRSCRSLGRCRETSGC
jgi:ribose transport system ATP-binding protein